MIAIAEKLDRKLEKWELKKSRKVAFFIAQIIDLGRDHEVDIASLTCRPHGGVANVRGIGSISTRHLEKKPGILLPRPFL